MMNIHTTCVAIKGQGVLLFGPPGSGKSDLALRLIMHKMAVLVADDRTDIVIKDNQIIASCPSSIKGLLEVRGVGIQKFPHLPSVEVKLVVELVKDYHNIDRLPEKKYYDIGGVKLPLLKLYPFENSATDKLVIKLDSTLD